MPKKPLQREVSGCDNCPFARKSPLSHAYCFLRPKLDISAHAVARTLLATIDGVGPYPSGCPLTQQVCTVRLAGSQRGGRPRPDSTPGRDLDSEGAFMLAWVKKTFPGGWPIALSELCQDWPWTSRYGPPLKLAHLYAAASGKRPFNEAEIDKLTAYLKDVHKYSGYTAAGSEKSADTLTTP